MAFNSTIKPKIGQCPECSPGVEKPLISGKCQYHYWQGKKKPLPKPTKPIRPRSKKRERQESKYRNARKKYLEENPVCEFPGCGKTATDIHHKKSRKYHLVDVSVFMAICREHHIWIHDNDAKSRELGFLLQSI